MRSVGASRQSRATPRSRRSWKRRLPRSSASTGSSVERPSARTRRRLRQGLHPEPRRARAASTQVRGIAPHRVPACSAWKSIAAGTARCATGRVPAQRWRIGPLVGGPVPAHRARLEHRLSFGADVEEAGTFGEQSHFVAVAGVEVRTERRRSSPIWPGACAPSTIEHAGLAGLAHSSSAGKRSDVGEAM